MHHLFILAFSLLIISQVYWLARAYRLLRKRIAVYVVLLVAYAGLFAFNVGGLFHLRSLAQGVGVTSLTLTDALIRGPFMVWVTCSLLAFLLAIPVWVVKKLVSIPLAPERRHFLERGASTVMALPFAAGAYGFVYGRLNLEVVHQRIRLSRLPREFDGFRIAQLSDIHIGPFMSERQIREFADLTNRLRPDMILLTGDFVTWDPATQQAVVHALAGLRAPFGVYACLGNHELWSHVSDSITALFQAAGIPVLRDSVREILSRGAILNLVGIDPRSRVERISGLIMPNTVNILISHYPDNFPRAAALGIDLTLAGHTHGGQVALDFVSPEIAPSRLVTPYVAGWFQEQGSQLYVNRGIGTIGVPMRAGAPPEITIFELKQK